MGNTITIKVSILCFSLNPFLSNTWNSPVPATSLHISPYCASVMLSTFYIFESQRTIATPWWYCQRMFREYCLSLDSYGQMEKRSLPFILHSNIAKGKHLHFINDLIRQLINPVNDRVYVQ